MNLRELITEIMKDHRKWNIYWYVFIKSVWPIGSKGKGKRSGGARVITYLYMKPKQFIYLPFYIKEKEDIKTQRT